MERMPGEPQPMRNPTTTRRYRRQARLQIYLPLAVILILVVAGGVLLWPGSAPAARAYADAALVFLILPVLLFGFIVLALVVGGVYLLVLLLRRLPEPAYRVQLVLGRVERKVRQGADMAARPMVRLSAIWAALRAIRLK